MHGLRWISVGLVIAVGVGAVVTVRAERAGPRHDTMGVVGSDGQPLPLDSSEEHETVSASGCGVERWPVKTAADADRAKVSTVVVSTSIKTLSALAEPSRYPTNNRIASAEFHVYQITATVTQYQEQGDSDIHLVLKDTAGRTMIAEIPSPNCVASTSRFRAGIAATRSTWDDAYPTFRTPHSIHRAVTVRGLGFFDRPHGQSGAAANGIELHPIIELQLN